MCTPLLLSRILNMPRVRRVRPCADRYDALLDNVEIDGTRLATGSKRNVRAYSRGRLVIELYRWNNICIWLNSFKYQWNCICDAKSMEQDSRSSGSKRKASSKWFTYRHSLTILSILIHSFACILHELVRRSLQSRLSRCVLSLTKQRILQ